MAKVLKPPALPAGSRVALISPASSAKTATIRRGLRELKLIGFQPIRSPKSERREGYFSGSVHGRSTELLSRLRSKKNDAVFCIRGGYGCAYLVDSLRGLRGSRPKILLGYSDITCLQHALWRKFGWAGFYGPMVAAGFHDGAGKPGGYDLASLRHALTTRRGGWSISLRGCTLASGMATGTILGGCVTLIENSIGTDWEVDTRDSIFMLEDRGVLPYQLDRMLVHLLQTRKFDGVRGILLGEFPDSAPPKGSRVTVLDVCKRLLGRLGIPVVYGAPVGHARRPMLTIPLGIRGRLVARGSGRLDVLEAAVTT